MQCKVKDGESHMMEDQRSEPGAQTQLSLSEHSDDLPLSLNLPRMQRNVQYSRARCKAAKRDEECMILITHRLSPVLGRQIGILLAHNAKLSYPTLEHILIRQALHPIQLPSNPLDDRPELHREFQFLHRGFSRRRRRLGHEIASSCAEEIPPDPTCEFRIAAVAFQLTALACRETGLASCDGIVERDTGAFPLFTHFLHVLSYDSLVFPFTERQPHLVLGQLEKVGEDFGLVGLCDGGGGGEGGRSGERS